MLCKLKKGARNSELQKLKHAVSKMHVTKSILYLSYLFGYLAMCLWDFLPFLFFRISSIPYNHNISNFPLSSIPDLHNSLRGKGYTDNWKIIMVCKEIMVVPHSWSVGSSNESPEILEAFNSGYFGYWQIYWVFKKCHWAVQGCLAEHLWPREHLLCRPALNHSFLFSTFESHLIFLLCSKSFSLFL